MRKKELKIVVTFHTTADAMAMEKICKEKGIPGRLIPVPRILSAGCGLAWAAPPEDKTQKLIICCARGKFSVDTAEQLTEREWMNVWFNPEKTGLPYIFNCVILKVNKIHHERKGREDEGNG